MSTASLEVSGLAFAYPDGHQALFGVDFTIGRGERVALLGPNGAGKTTLVLHLNGILSGGAGTVKVAGLEVGKRNMAEIRRRVGIVFQDPDDQLFMPTVREDVAFGPAAAGLKGAELEARVDRALERVGMAEFKDRPAAPPLLRAAAPGGRGDRAGDGAGDPRPGRAVLQPRPGLAP
ncbi:energy-coupling factor transporter ATP-binding protein EcfA2 [Streptomyces albogriseolus]|uniref:Energy-coupling factor transporter ATP-binding protein EcfA2 n=1 Tax=Streptomyces albogriseolus TaxID=1887 RepID=A0ACC6UMH3_STRAO